MTEPVQNVSDDIAARLFEYITIGDTAHLAELLKDYPGARHCCRHGVHTPVEAAILDGNGESLRWLLTEGGFDINAQHGAFVTPVFFAIDNKKGDMANILIDMDADLSLRRERWGDTPLMIAVAHDPSLVLGILQHGVDVDAQDMAGNTALMYAVLFGQVGCLRQLMENGASLDVKNNDGITAQEYTEAEENPRPDIADMIEAERQRRRDETVQEFRAGLKEPLTVGRPVVPRKGLRLS